MRHMDERVLIFTPDVKGILVERTEEIDYYLLGSSASVTAVSLTPGTHQSINGAVYGP